MQLRVFIMRWLYQLGATRLVGYDIQLRVLEMIVN